MQFRNLMIGISGSLIAGLISSFFPIIKNSPYRWFIVIGIVVVIILISLWLIVGRLIFRLKRIGIKNVVSSMTRGKGGTEYILQTVIHQFSFMGIAARKWIDTGEDMEAVLRRIGGFRKEPVRFLLLDPDSEVAKNISRTQHHGDENEIPERIRNSIEYLKKMRKDRGYRIQLNLYSFQPIFRIAIVNNDKAYVGYYRSATKGQNSPQLILDQKPEITFFQPFQEYFKEIWENQSVECDLEK